jgi:hypothetical protein
LKLLFASDVPLRGLHRSVPEEKLNLFQLASTTMAEARARSAKIVGCEIAYAGLPGAPLHRVPDYVGCHTSFLSYSPLQNPPEYLSLSHSRMPEPGIEKLFAPRRYRYGSQSFSFPDQIDNDPTTLPRLQLVEVQTHDFRASQSTSQQQSKHCAVSPTAQTVLGDGVN